MSVVAFEMCVIPLFLLPLYVLLASFFFIASLGGRGFKAAVSPLLGLSGLCIPFFIIFLAMSSLRFFEGPALLSQLFFSRSSVRAGLLGGLSVLGFLFTMLISGGLASAVSWSFLGCFIGLLSFAFILSSALTNLFSYFFFFEVVGLLLLLVLLSIGDISDAGHNSGLNSPAALTNKFAITGVRLNAYLTFLWISALALVSIVWAVAGLIRLGLSLDVRSSCILRLPTKGGSAAVYASILLIGLSLKIAALPTHGWLFAFYTNLPLNSILAYFQLYYLFFLIMIGRLIQGTLLDLTPYWLGSLSLVMFIFSLMLTSIVGEAGRIKHALAVSSILNTTMILIMFLP